MNARQILNKLIDELPSKFVVIIESKHAKHSNSNTDHEKVIYIGVYDEDGIYYQESSRHINGETWAEVLKKYEKLAEELKWK